MISNALAIRLQGIRPRRRARRGANGQSCAGSVSPIQRDRIRHDVAGGLLRHTGAGQTHRLVESGARRQRNR